MELKAITPAQHMGFLGAESFPNGDLPLYAEGTIEGDEVIVIVDKAGVAIFPLDAEGWGADACFTFENSAESAAEAVDHFVGLIPLTWKRIAQLFIRIN